MKHKIKATHTFEWDSDKPAEEIIPYLFAWYENFKQYGAVIIFEDGTELFDTEFEIIETDGKGN